MYLWTARVSSDHLPILRDLKTTGYDGVEIPVLEGSPSEYADLAGILDDLGLARTAAGAILDSAADPLSEDPWVRRRALDSAVEALDRVEALGARLLAGPMYQVLGRFTGEGPNQIEAARAVDFHRALGDAARERSITVALEPLNRFEAYFLNLASQTRDHVERVAHPNIAMMYDTFHANIEEADPVEAFRRTASHTAHIHISENDRGVPGRGHVPWARTFEAIRSSGYDGWLTIEAFGRGLPALAAATKIWRDLSETPEEVYREGYRLIRDRWDAAEA